MAQNFVMLGGTKMHVKKASIRIFKGLKKSKGQGCYIVGINSYVADVLMSHMTEKQILNRLNELEGLNVAYVTFDWLKSQLSRFIFDNYYMSIGGCILLAIIMNKTMAKDRVIPFLIGKPLPSIFIEYINYKHPEVYNYVTGREEPDVDTTIKYEMMVGKIQEDITEVLPKMIKSGDLFFTVTNSVWLTNQFKNMLLGKNLSFYEYRNKVLINSRHENDKED